MTRISISNPRRERLKGYERLKLRRAGRGLGKALALTVRPPEKQRFIFSTPTRGGDSWVLEMLAPNANREPLPRFDLSDIPNVNREPMDYWKAMPIHEGDTRDDER